MYFLQQIYNKFATINGKSKMEYSKTIFLKRKSYEFFLYTTNSLELMLW